MLAWVLNLGFGGSSSALPAPTFSGTIADFTLPRGGLTSTYDYSSYFSGATSYSVTTLPYRWSFDTATGILTIDPVSPALFGPFIITGTNINGSDVSNSFYIRIAGGDSYEPSVKHKLKKLKKKDESLVAYLENVYKALNEAPPKFAREMRQIVKPEKTPQGFTVNFDKLSENLSKVEKLAALHEEYIRVQEEEDAITLMLLH